MAGTILEKIGAALDRRTFLSKIVTIAGSLLVGIVATPKRSEALTPVACCSLCNVSCTYNPANCASQWRWHCCHMGRRYWCYECFAPGFECQGTYCVGVICSKAECIGTVSGTACPDAIEGCV